MNLGAYLGGEGTAVTPHLWEDRETKRQRQRKGGRRMRQSFAL